MHFGLAETEFTLNFKIISHGKQIKFTECRIAVFTMLNNGMFELFKRRAVKYFIKIVNDIFIEIVHKNSIIYGTAGPAVFEDHRCKI